MTCLEVKIFHTLKIEIGKNKLFWNLEGHFEREGKKRGLHVKNLEEKSLQRFSKKIIF